MLELNDKLTLTKYIMYQSMTEQISGMPMVRNWVYSKDFWEHNVLEFEDITWLLETWVEFGNHLNISWELYVDTTTSSCVRGMARLLVVDPKTGILYGCSANIAFLEFTEGISCYVGDTIAPNEGKFIMFSEAFMEKWRKTKK